MKSPATYSHTAFGLAIRSCLPLPELLPAPADAVPDIEIEYGDVPAELPGVLKRGVRFQSALDALRLQVDGIATYLVAEGKRITITRDPGAVDDDVRLFLLGSGLGALLHQRDDLVLHGSAVDWQGGAVIFLGYSGTGKSTLAAALRKKGHAVLTDDLCVVRPDATGRMLAYPGFPQTKLWLDSLKQLDISPDGLNRIRHKLEKRALPLGESFRGKPLPVKKLFPLNSHHRDEVKLVPIEGPEKFLILRNQTYRFGFLAAIGRKAGHFQQAMRLAQQVPMAGLVRPIGTFRLKELVEVVEADLTP